MSAGIVQSQMGVTLLGAGTAGPLAVAEALTIAPVLVAADGGADRALALGLMPAAVIGDLDSIDAKSLAAIPAERLHRIEEQATTDFDKCLRSIDAPFILAVGFTGPRLDHTLAVFNALIRHPDKICLLLGEADVSFLCPPELTLDLPSGTRVSLFPFGPAKGTSTGLRWPINGLEFDAGGFIGTSNETDAAQQIIRIQGPMIVILPRSALAAALRALLPGWACDAPPPVPGG